MKAIQKHEAAYGARLTNVEIPKIKPGQVLMKLKAASICGTDIHIYKWDEWAQGRIKPPLVFGHECCGEVVEVGEGVTEVKKGDMISTETHISCRSCFQCLTGNEHICQNVKLLGVDVAGIFADYSAIPGHNCWVNDKALAPEIATAQEPMGNAVHTIFECDVPSNTVTVFGCGPIGLCAISICKFIGARKVIAIDVNDYRLGLAQKMGADVVIDASKEKTVEIVKRETGGRGADVFLELSGSPQAIHDGFDSLRAGGEASILGIPSEPVTIDFANQVVFKSARIYGINGRKMYSTWFKTAELLKAGAVDLRKIVTHKFRFGEFEKAFEVMASGDSGKVVLTP
jgi:threonine 3-dehydrogenase